MYNYATDRWMTTVISDYDQGKSKVSLRRSAQSVAKAEAWTPPTGAQAGLRRQGVFRITVQEQGSRQKSRYTGISTWRCQASRRLGTWGSVKALVTVTHSTRGQAGSHQVH